MAKILTITLNPAIDVTIELTQLKVGAVNRQENVVVHAAGKGLNVAQVLHDLGHQVLVSGFLGEQNRTIFDQHFAQMQFDNQFVYLDAQTRQNIKLAEQSGQMTDINGQGFVVSAADKQQLLDKMRALAADVEYVVIAGSLPQGFAVEDLTALIEVFHQADKKVALDTSKQALVAAIACHPWMIKPNTDELEESYGKPVPDLPSQQALFQKLGAKIEHIVISMGEQGVHWLQQHHTLHALPAKVQVKSTVGAGDSLLAGMIHGLVTGASDEETLKTATAIASNAVSQIGFRIPDPEQLDDLKQHTTVKTLS